MPRYDDDNIENRHSKRKRDHSDDEMRISKHERRNHHDRDLRNSHDRSPPPRDRQRRERSRTRHDERRTAGDERRHVRGEDRRPERDRDHSIREPSNHEHRRYPNSEGNNKRGDKPIAKWGNEAKEAAFDSKKGEPRHVWGHADKEAAIESEKNKPLLDKDGKPIEKEKPNFEKSGKLTEHTNTFNGVVVKYNEPKEARMPKKKKWRLYPYKGEESLKVLHLHRQSAFLFGRDRRVADIPLDHPSISQQHAVLQYRAMPYTRPDGVKTRAIYPYLIDLESSNGTFLNNEKIEPRRYVELKEGDVLKFGFSTREYVLLCETSTEAILMENEDFED